MIHRHRLEPKKMEPFPVAEAYILCIDSVTLKWVRNLPVTILSVRAAGQNLQKFSMVIVEG